MSQRPDRGGCLILLLLVIASWAIIYFIIRALVS